MRQRNKTATVMFAELAAQAHEITGSVRSVRKLRSQIRRRPPADIDLTRYTSESGIGGREIIVDRYRDDPAQPERIPIPVQPPTDRGSEAVGDHRCFPVACGDERKFRRRWRSREIAEPDCPRLDTADMMPDRFDGGDVGGPLRDHTGGCDMRPETTRLANVDPADRAASIGAASPDCERSSLNARVLSAKASRGAAGSSSRTTKQL